MDLLVEKNIGGSEVLGVRNDDELKTFVQEVFNKTEEPAAENTNDTSNSPSTGSSNNSSTDGSSGGGTSSEP
ncbi:hypothetical protein D3C80_2132790 [compost metagenome]